MRICNAPDCRTKHYSRGYCSKHYQERRRLGLLPVNQPKGVAVVCKVDGCEKPVKCKELCTTHYSYWRRTGRLQRTEPYENELECSVQDCNRNRLGQGLCKMHLMRLRRTGSTERRIAEPLKPCSIPNCETLSHARGWCEKHYGRWRKGGLTEEVIRNGDLETKSIADILEDLEELLSFGVSDVEELWTRAGFKNEQHMRYHVSEKQRLRIWGS